MTAPAPIPRVDESGEIQWPAWVPPVVAIAPVALTIAALFQRTEVGAPELAFGLVTVAPWLFQAVRGTRPRFAGYRLVFSAVVLAGFAGLVLEPAEVDVIAFVPVMLLFEVAMDSPPWQSGLVLVASEAVMLYVEIFDTYQQSYPWLLAFALAWCVGAGFRAQLGTLVELRKAQGDLARRAAAGERQRIAREVHDVVAHSLSVTMLHLTGARHSLETGGAIDDAVEALREAESAGRQSLADIRRTVGLLGEGGEGGGLAPEPAAADIPSLVDGMAAAGLDVSLSVRGDLAAVPLATGLGLYRIAQESLANASRHAPGAPVAVSVAVGAGGGSVTLVVRNGGPFAPSAGAGAGGGGGLGLPGMKERAVLLGGSFAAGPDGDGGWVVEVSVP